MSRTIRVLCSSLALALVSSAPQAQQPTPQPAPQGRPPQQQVAPLPANGWRIDMSHSSVGFRVRHLGISWVNGRFTRWSGDLVFDPANPTAASVSARIATATVNTENERRDNDIRSGNYLAVDSFPEMVFVSKRVEVVDATHLRVIGDLTIRGVTNPVTLDTEILGTMGGQRGKRMAFTATTTISRMDFGVAFNALMEGAQIVGNEIRITIDIEATQPNP
jgi:polyisoprenoid-binding protein YceI